jgi:hypothetical protein
VGVQAPGDAARVVIRLLSLAAGLLFVLPWQPFEIGNPVDYSWMLTLHRAFSERWAFGRRVLFTFGPWGFLYGAYTPETRGWYVTGWAVIVSALVIALGAVLGWRIRTVPVILAASLLFALAPPDVMLLLLSALVVLAWSGDHRLELAVVAFAAALVALTKFTCFIAAGAVVVLITADDGWRRRVPLALTAFVSSTIFWWVVAGQSLANFPRFMWASIRLSSGYSESMALEAQANAPSLLWFLAAAVFALFVLVRSVSPDKRIVALVAMSSVIFVVTKAAYVRHDDHALIGVTFMAALTIILLARSGPDLWTRGAATIALTVALLALHFDLATYTPGGIIRRVVAVARPMFSAARMPWSAGRIARARFEARMAATRLKYLLPPVGVASDSYPGIASILLADAIPYFPRPSFQAVGSACAAFALAANRDWLDSAAAAQAVFFDIKTADQWFPALEEGSSWPLLLTRYRPADARFRMLELVRRPRPLAWQMQPLSETTARFDQPISPPSSADPLWCTIEVEPTLLGRVVKTLWKMPPIRMHVELRDGTTKNYRFVPIAGRAGFVLSPLVRNWPDFVWLASDEWSSRLAPYEVTRFTLRLSHRSFHRALYEPTIRVRFQALRFPHESVRDLPGHDTLETQRARLSMTELDKWP